MSRRAMLAHRHARFLQRGHLERGLAEDYYTDDPVGLAAEVGRDSTEYTTYRDWLMDCATRQGRGGRMRRALIRAEQKYIALKPAHLRAGQLHRSYARKSR